MHGVPLAYVKCCRPGGRCPRSWLSGRPGCRHVGSGLCNITLPRSDFDHAQRQWRLGMPDAGVDPTALPRHCSLPGRNAWGLQSTLQRSPLHAPSEPRRRTDGLPNGGTVKPARAVLQGTVAGTFDGTGPVRRAGWLANVRLGPGSAVARVLCRVPRMVCPRWIFRSHVVQTAIDDPWRAKAVNQHPAGVGPEGFLKRHGGASPFG